VGPNIGPLDHSLEELIMSAKLQTRGPVLPRTTILLAEDDEDDVLLIKAAFEAARLSFNLMVVRDGEEAIDYLHGTGRFADRTTFPLPFMLLLDLKMPQVSGFEVLSWVRSQRALDQLLVIILTGSAMESDLKQTEDLGNNAYIVKSSDYQQLIYLFQSLKPSHEQ
jgi:CheY-like chemotaxis protein